MVARHNNCLLLLQNLPLVAGTATLRSRGLLCDSSESSNRGACRHRGALRSSQWRRDANNTAAGDGAGSSASRRRHRNIGQGLDIFLGEFVLGRSDLSRRRFSRCLRSSSWRLFNRSWRLCNGHFIGDRRDRELFRLDGRFNLLRRLGSSSCGRDGGLGRRGGSSRLGRCRSGLRLRKHLGPRLLRGRFRNRRLLHGLRCGGRLGLYCGILPSIRSGIA